MAHRLGFAVKVVGDGGRPSHDTRRWQSEPHLRVSLERLAGVFDYLESVDIRMYRMASALVPYGSHPDMPQHAQVEECREQLSSLGRRARAADIRLSFHPGQYVVLNSEDERVRRAAVLDLELHASVLDAMGAGPEAVVVLHVGGARGGTRAGLDRFASGFELLGEPRPRQAGDRERRCSVRPLRRPGALAERTGMRVVWDELHHRCHDPDGIPAGEALRLALATWDGEALAKIHYSSPRTDVEERRERVGRRVRRRLVMPSPRAHADLIDPGNFEDFLNGPGAGREFDVMLEAKAKDLALIRLRNQLCQRGFRWSGGRIERVEADACR